MPFSKEFYTETWPNGYAFAKLIIPALRDFAPVESVLEIGCGAGGFLKWCYEQGMYVRGVEVGDIKGVAQIPEDLIYSVDMSQPATFNVQFDVCVSLEVAEHIEEQYADTFVKNLCASAPIILFSAARIGQPGDGHINCQDKEYWIEKFSKQDFKAYLGFSGLFRGNVDIPTYYRENSVMFIKNNF
jgi:SAM-dependent methyltransferase